MTLAPLPEPLDSEEIIFSAGEMAYADDHLTLQRHAAGTLGIICYTVALLEPVTAAAYALLASVLNLYGHPDLVQCGEGDSAGGWLWLEFSTPELPRPRSAS